ncbi:uncharacterized protein K452DRAFT_283985 [Aplosporella prunicola CBS 121167]|uniref:Uncharacterized protein n=1 Tax=Aplosporella prunicola CBS 121167 TaxID=1176127 RepID=A0A6A6BNC1_9PEZI|nr:uncharacterized protein K452DRAFT_283985 [Aplosporella prunicola CBS 121167]KAF2145630.1 hypothetical protein K452DRAFT_283985 [Aplosporella prunicola CBS 121167]
MPHTTHARIMHAHNAHKPLSPLSFLIRSRVTLPPSFPLTNLPAFRNQQQSRTREPAGHHCPLT